MEWSWDGKHYFYKFSGNDYKPMIIDFSLVSKSESDLNGNKKEF